MKYYRRRPKGRLTTCQSSTILAAMAKRVISAQQKDDQDETTLSEECLQYLQSIDAADKFSNAPNSIDQTAWNHLCRMRRTKIEAEFKVNHDFRDQTNLNENFMESLLDLSSYDVPVHYKLMLKLL